MTSPPKSEINRAAPAGLIRDESALAVLAAEAGGLRLYLVGGSVRDSLLGGGRLDLDVAVDGPVEPLATGLDPDAVLHSRFDTAAISIAGTRVDLARTRSETYGRPGALPEVEPAGIEADLARRDFTINAIAVPFDEPATLIDPHGGVEDLERRVIRVIHDRSFVDDPTRALRAARYAARLGFEIDDRTGDLLREVDLDTVSSQRITSELHQISEEPTAVEALRLASAWGLVEIPEDELQVIGEAFDLLARDPWADSCSRADVVMAVVEGGAVESVRDLIGYPGSPSGGAAIARRREPVELLLARAAGGEWLDAWVSDWRRVGLQITGDDLVSQGVPSGERVGIGLRAALEAALDRGLSDRDGQLSVALEAAQRPEDGQAGAGE